MNPLDNQPIVSIAMSISGCAYDVRVNDVTIMADPEGSVLETAIPVNEWLQSGTNTFSMHLTPVGKPDLKILEENNATCIDKATVQIRSNTGAVNYPLTTLVYNSAPDVLPALLANTKGSAPAQKLTFDKGFIQNDKGQYVIGDVQIEKEVIGKNTGVDVSRSFSIPLPFPKWQWLSAETLTNNQETLQEVTAQYMKIYNALKNKNIESLSDLFTIRFKETAEAYYLPTASANIIPELEKYSRDPNVSQMEFDPQYGFLHLAGNGKLAKITDWTGQQSPIAFVFKKGGGISYDFTFAKINGKWVIVR